VISGERRVTREAGGRPATGVAGQTADTRASDGDRRGLDRAETLRARRKAGGRDRDKIRGAALADSAFNRERHHPPDALAHRDVRRVRRDRDHLSREVDPGAFREILPRAHAQCAGAHDRVDLIHARCMDAHEGLTMVGVGAWATPCLHTRGGPYRSYSMDAPIKDDARVRDVAVPAPLAYRPIRPGTGAVTASGRGSARQGWPGGDTSPGRFMRDGYAPHSYLGRCRFSSGS